MVRVAGFDPAVSCARGTRFTRLSYTLMEHTAGVEPAFSVRLPLILLRKQEGYVCMWQSRLVSVPLLAAENCKSRPVDDGSMLAPVAGFEPAAWRLTVAPIHRGRLTGMIGGVPG